MAKVIAFLFLIIVLAGIFYVYYTNTTDVGIQVEKIKLKYSIGDATAPEQILLFASELDKLSLSAKDQDKMRLLFESNFWNSVGLSKSVAEVLGSAEIGVLQCGKDDKSIKEKVANAKQSIVDAKEDFKLIKTSYTNTEQKEFEVKIENIEYSIFVSENVIFTLCPK